MPHQNPVFPDEGNDIGDRRQRDEVQQVVGEPGGQPEHRDQGLHQLERDARAAEHPEAVGVRSAIGIHDRGRGRQLGAGEMVIGDDDPDPGRFGRPGGFDGRDAAITGDDQAGAALFRAGEAGRTKVVPITEPVGNERDHLGTGEPEGAGQDRDGGLAVDVVVPVDHDRLMGRHRFGNEAAGGPDRGERFRRTQRLEGRPQKGFARRRDH